MPAPTPVRGITELSRAFALAGAEFHKDKTTLLRGLAAPVAKDAERMALAEQVGVSWSRMRTGATPVSSYVAPVNRGTRIRARKRRNFASFLIGTAMEPALEANRASINRKLDALVERLTRRWNRG